MRRDSAASGHEIMAGVGTSTGATWTVLLGKLEPHDGPRSAARPCRSCSQVPKASLPSANKPNSLSVSSICASPARFRLRKQTDTRAVEVRHLGPRPIATHEQVEVAGNHVVFELLSHDRGMAASVLKLFRMSHASAHAYTLTPTGLPITPAS